MTISSDTQISIRVVAKRNCSKIVTLVVEWFGTALEWFPVSRSDYFDETHYFLEHSMSLLGEHLVDSLPPAQL